MKIKHIFKFLIFALLAIQLGSCTNTDAEQKFDQTPTERLNAQKKELSDLLLASEHGWKAVYFTDNTQLGGFTHLFKFTNDGKVEMASDFDADTDSYVSDYSIELGSTVRLLFSTKNRIHLLSDSNNYPTQALRGKGYKGDFQFLYYGQENGEIIFKTNRSFEELRFVKATAEDWADLSKNTVMSENISSKLFRLFETNDGATKHQFNFDPNYDARFATANSLEPGSSEFYNVAYSLTATGITVKPAIVVKGQQLTDFVYDSVTQYFVATGTNGVSATIKHTFTPPVLTDDYKILLPGRATLRFGYYPDDYIADAPTNSKFFYEEFDKINALLPAGQFVTSVQIYTNHSLGNFIYYTFSGRSAIFHYVDIIEDATGKKIILKHKSWNGNTTVAPPAFLASFDSHLSDPNGIYVKKENFKMYYSNTVYTFTSSSSSFRISAWLL